MNPPESPAPESGNASNPLRKVTLTWILVMALLFPILILAGLVLRAAQSNLLPSLPPDHFYALMTLHGLGMVGLWFVAATAGVSYLLVRYVRPSKGMAWFALLGTVVGVVIIVAITEIGRFGAGWYFLYPLPLRAAGAWPAWATTGFLLALAVLGVTWTAWIIDLLRAIASRYSMPVALCWNYLRGNPTPEVPPIILITTVSLIAALAGLIAAVVVLVLLCLEWFGAGVSNDALLVKNLTFLFGHLLVNISLYLGVGLVYEILPAYAGRPWKNNRNVALAWNAVLVLVIAAFLHHLYMDFVQLRWLHVIGQIASYLTSVPAAVMSIFGGLALIYRAEMKWKLAPLLMFVGLLGWTIGGIGAVIDSTVAVNVRFHNTLWVPAHFHTYFLMGVVLMILGATLHICQKDAGLTESVGMTRLIVGLLCVGGFGFVLMFYTAGAHSVPRRYAAYPSEVAAGVAYARSAVWFVAIFLAGLVLYLWQLGRNWLRALKAA